MEDKNLTYFIGRLAFEQLFVGSKSEGLYPVLKSNNGQLFRLHTKGKSIGEEKSLLPFEGKIVKVFGIADNIRGHWRILLSGEDSILVSEFIAPRLENMVSISPNSEQNQNQNNQLQEGS